MARAAYIIIVISIAACASHYYCSEYFRIHHGAMCTGCCANLYNIGRGLDEYARQHNGKYPDTLPGLIPKYLGEIPRCPAGKYNKHSRYEYAHSTKPEAYTVYCRGDFHTPMYNQDCPKYSSIEGPKYNWTY